MTFCMWACKLAVVPRHLNGHISMPICTYHCDWIMVLLPDLTGLFNVWWLSGVSVSSTVSLGTWTYSQLRPWICYRILILKQPLPLDASLAISLYNGITVAVSILQLAREWTHSFILSSMAIRAAYRHAGDTPRKPLPPTSRGGVTGFTREDAGCGTETIKWPLLHCRCHFGWPLFPGVQAKA